MLAPLLLNSNEIVHQENPKLQFENEIESDK